MNIKSVVKCHYRGLLSTAFFVLALLLWWLWLPEVTAYHEQNQMFLLTPDYFLEHLTLPGAFADYASESLVQLGFFVFWGAAAAALMLVLMHRVAWRIMRQCGTGEAWWAISFVPPVLMAAQCTDADTLPTYTLAMLGAMAAAWLRIALRRRSWAWVADVVLIPLAYWLLGPVSITVVAAAAACALLPNLRHDTTRGRAAVPVAVPVAAWAAAFWLTGQSLQYSWGNLLKGLFYYRQPDTLPLTLALLTALCALWPFVAAAMARANGHKLVPIAVSLACIAAAALLGMGTQRQLLEVVDYEYLLRMHHYSDIIKKSSSSQPTSEVGVAATNLALSATGQMPDRMFEFRQFGTSGLLPTENLDAHSTMTASDIFWYLGMVNQAQRYCFESQEAMPNYKRSSRCYCRLAETNLVNADYGVAARYLRLLSHTLFYRQWALKRLHWAEADHQAVDNDVQYARIRQTRPVADYLSGMSETDLTLGQLYMHNRDNHAALEYLMAYELLARNAQRFMQYFPIVLQAAPNHIPRSYQEGLAAFTMKTPGNRLAALVDHTTRQQMHDFLDIYAKDSAAASHYDNPPFADTYWFYLFGSNTTAAQGGAETSAPAPQAHGGATQNTAK